MSDEITVLLREIRDQQTQQLQRQAESLALQREHVALHQDQYARAERINERAEAIQGRAGKAIKSILWLAMPLVVLLLALMPWPYLRWLLAWR